MDFRYGRLKAPGDQATGYTTASVPCRGARGVMFGFKGTGGATTAWGICFGDVANPLIAGTGTQPAGTLLPTGSNGAAVIGAPTGVVTLANTWMLWTGLTAVGAANAPLPPIPFPYVQFFIASGGTLTQLEIWAMVFFDKFYKEDPGMIGWDPKYWASLLA